MARRINTYVPAGSPPGWSAVAEQVRAIVATAEPLTCYSAAELMGVLTKLALFAHAEGLPATAQVWLSREVIERFVLGCTHLTNGTKGTYRSKLLRLREAILGGDCATGKPVKLTASDAARPYTPAQMAALWSWACGQPTKQLRDGCQTLLALGRGCGLDSPEIIPLRAHDVRRIEGGPVVVAVRGNRQRLVLCRRAWERVLAEAAAALDGQAAYLFRPGRQGSSSLSRSSCLALFHTKRTHTSVSHRSLTERGYLAGDLAYNNSDPDTFQLPARALGYRLVFDYRDDQLGIQAGAHGALQIEGRWYCPSIPQPLIGATQTFRAAAPDDAAQAATAADLYRRQITARTAYELTPKGKPDAEGHQRLSCPATAGKVQCPIKPASMGTDPRLPPVRPTPSPAGPPTICRQHSITIAPEHGAKHAQALPYSTADQQRVYHRLRSSTEGFNGYAKDDAHEAIQRSQGRRIRGIAAQSLLLAFQLAHANFRKIFRWLDSLPRIDGRPRRRIRRRTTKPLND
ncbi:hypothetical protein AB0M44_32185 [Streptosporangium subroseum]|uniref:hypothetical protein n=1 Tax=Streptosporangium subroseum TaxID=106412 RepID=UPI00343D491F